MKWDRWMTWALAGLGLGAAGATAYKFWPVSGSTTLGVGSVVKLSMWGKFSDVKGAPVQILGKSTKPGMYSGTYPALAKGAFIDFSPSDIASVQLKAPSTPLLAGFDQGNWDMR